MSWSYSGDPTKSKIDEYRFLLGDTIAEEPIMQDEEIQYIIEMCNGDENQVRYHLFSRAATLFARDIKRKLGPQTEDPTDRLNYFKEKAKEYKSKITLSGLSVPTYAYPKVFRKGMHSNPPWPSPKRGDYRV